MHPMMQNSAKLPSTEALDETCFCCLDADTVLPASCPKVLNAVTKANQIWTEMPLTPRSSSVRGTIGRRLFSPHQRSLTSCKLHTNHWREPSSSSHGSFGVRCPAADISEFIKSSDEAKEPSPPILGWYKLKRRMTTITSLPAIPVFAIRLC